MFGFLAARRFAPRSSVSRPQFQPTVEALEDRIALAANAFIDPNDGDLKIYAGNETNVTAVAYEMGPYGEQICGHVQVGPRL